MEVIEFSVLNKFLTFKINLHKVNSYKCMLSKEKVQIIIIYIFDVFLAESQLHVIIHPLHTEFINVYPVKNKRKRKCSQFDFRKYIGG